MSKDDVKLELVEEKEQGIDKECAEEIDAVLKKHNRTLQAFLPQSEYGIIPRIRLLRVPAKAEDNGEEVQ